MSPPPSHPVQPMLLRPEFLLKIRAVDAAMRARFRAAEWPEDDIDLLFTHYLFGLVMAALPEVEAPTCVAALLGLGGEVLAAAAIERALHRLPPEDPSFALIAPRVEAIGGRDALALCEVPRSTQISPVAAGPTAMRGARPVAPLVPSPLAPAATRYLRGSALAAASGS